LTRSLPPQPLRITVRADGSPALGYGHLQRTLAVVTRLRALTGWGVRYLMQPDSDAGPVEAGGCGVVRVAGGVAEPVLASAGPGDGPLILDTHALTTGDLERLRQAGFCVAVFDDGLRLDGYPAHLIVDYAPGAEQLLYRGLVDTRFCLGPAYYPLRDEFLAQPPRQKCSAEVDRVVVTFGGSDPDDQTARVVRLVAERAPPWKLVVILGPGYGGRADGLALPEGRVEWRRDTTNMAQVLTGADLAVSGAGGTALELAYLGVPALLLVLAEDQRRIAAALAGAGAAANLGWFEQVSDDEIWQSVDSLAGDPARRDAMRAAGRRLVDGGGTERVAQAILDAWGQHRDKITKGQA
jgi:UDP-2,4-diacetamido-2,4,6-trideoxy-beta-L-altropyranose hydrolase